MHKPFCTPEGFFFLKELGNGFLGPTALVKDCSTNEVLVCKIVEKSRLGAPSLSQRFIERLDHIQTLKSPFIVGYSKIIEDDYKIFLFRQFIDSEPLTSNLSGIQSTQYISMWKNLLKTYHHLHQHHIFPSFINPNNIFLMQNQYLLVTDVYPPPQDINPLLHSPNPFEIGFLAPEYFAHRIEPTEAADVWALGILLIFMVKGSLPWAHKNVFTLIHSIMSTKVDIPQEIPPELRKILKLMLIPDPENRITLKDMMQNDDSIQAMSSKLKHLDSYQPNQQDPLDSPNQEDRPDTVPSGEDSHRSARDQHTSRMASAGFMVLNDRSGRLAKGRATTTKLLSTSAGSPPCLVRCRISDRPIAAKRSLQMFSELC